MKYKSGVCNIDKAGKRKRQMVGMLGLVSSCLLYVLLLIQNLPWWTGFTVILPLFLMTLGYNQSNHSFCVQLALEGKSNLGKLRTVPHKHHYTDRRAAYILLFKSFVAAVILDLVLVLLLLL